MPKRRKRMNGQGPILDKIKGFLKKHRIISRAAGALAPLAGAYSPVVSGVGEFARSQGYGRRGRRRRVGRPKK